MENGEFWLMNKTYLPQYKNETASFVFLTGFICFKISKYCVFGAAGIRKFVKNGENEEFYFVTTVPSLTV